MRSRRTINSPCIIDLSYGLVHNNKGSYSLAKISTYRVFRLKIFSKKVMISPLTYITKLRSISNKKEREHSVANSIFCTIFVKGTV